MTFHYSVRGLLVQQGRLGTELPVRVGDREVTVVLPVSPQEQDDHPGASPAPAFDDRFPRREPMPLLDGAQDLHVTLSVTPVHPTETAGVKVDLVRVVVHHDAQLSVADYAAEGGASQAVWEVANAAMDAAGVAADTAVERLVAWSRVRRGQTWLGLYGERVQRIGSDELVDLDAGRRLPWPARADMAFQVVERDTAWDADGLAELQTLIDDSGLPTPAETLLADARFLISAAAPPDPSRALLIAAVACEVKIKTFLQERATRAQAPLVELLLERPRDWSMAASALFHQPLHIVAGSSLKEADVRLYKRIVQLFERRNALAHRGQAPSQAHAFDSVNAAREVFTWLATLPPPS
jgi:hypothetical protein